MSGEIRNFWWKGGDQMAALSDEDHAMLATCFELELEVEDDQGRHWRVVREVEDEEE